MMDRYQAYFNMWLAVVIVVGRCFAWLNELMVGSDVFTSGPLMGHGGIGSFFAGIFRRVLQLFTRGAMAVGKEGLRAGMNIMSDVTRRNSPFKESIRQRFKESGEVLKRNAEEKLDKLMEGSGYKPPRYGLPLYLRMGFGSDTNYKGKKKQSSSKKRKTSKSKSNSSKKGKVKRNKTEQKKKKRTTRDIFG